MFRFLRRYSKVLLAVFGTLLMIVFLIPQAIQSLSQRAAIGSATWAEIGPEGDEVPVSMRYRSNRDLEMLQRVGIPIGPFGILDNPSHWYLLTLEAERAGLIPATMLELGDRDRTIVLNVLGNNRQVNDTLCRYLGVRRLMSLYQGATKISDRRMIGRASDMLYGVDVRLLVLEARVQDGAPLPTKDAIDAHFQDFRDSPPGSPDSRFGYRLPDRFTLEWLTIDRDSLLDLIESSDDLNGVALAMHWDDHRDDPDLPPFELGAEIPESVRNHLLEALVDRKIQAIERYITSQIIESQRVLEPGPDGSVQLPGNWDDVRIDFEVLAGLISREFPGIPLPAYHTNDDGWLTIDDLLTLEDIGGSTTDTYGTPLSISQSMASLKEFVETPTIPLQAGIASNVYRTLNGGCLVFRVTGTDPSRPPKDAEEAGDRLITDMQRLAAYDQLATTVNTMEEALRRDGILQFALDRETQLQQSMLVTRYNLSQLLFQIQSNLPLNASGSTLPVIGQHDDTIRRIVEHAQEIVTEGPLRDLPFEARSIILPVEDKLALLVIEMRRQAPLDSDRYASLITSTAIVPIVMQDELNNLEYSLADAFGLEALAERNEFSVLVSEDVQNAQGEDEEPGS